MNLFKTQPITFVIFLLSTLNNDVLANINQTYHTITVVTPIVSAVLNREAVLSCRANGWIPSSCIFQKVGITAHLVFINSTTDVNGTQIPEVPGYFYIGAGLEEGDCGIRILNVVETDVGEWACQYIKDDGGLTGTVKLELWKKPEAPFFSMDFGNVKEGETKSVTCLSFNDKAQPSFQWFIGDKPIEGSALSAGTLNKTFENGTHASLQTLTNYGFSWKDNGKELKCSITHESLTRDDVKEVTQKINVLYSPHGLDDKTTITIRQPIVGTQMLIQFDIIGNPKPCTTWRVGKETIHEGNKSMNGSYEAKTIIVDDPRFVYYRAELIIKNVEEADVTANYTMMAENSVGNAEFVVVLSTKPFTRSFLESIDYTLAGISSGSIVAVSIILLICIVLQQRKQRRNQLQVSNFSKANPSHAKKSSPKAVAQEVNETMESVPQKEVDEAEAVEVDGTSETKVEQPVDVAEVSTDERIVENKV